MKKIMFNDKYDLTAAVLIGKKTMTRRIIKAPRRTIEGKEVCGFAIHKTSDGVPYEVWLTGPDEESLCQLLPTYKVGEIVAVAQSYNVLAEQSINNGFVGENIDYQIHFKNHKGWTNKMFVKPDLMPHHIRITDIKVERLQDISDDDCLNEGLDWIIGTPGILKKWTFFGTKKTWNTRREAFAALIDKVSGKGTWDRNPWVFAYSFVLID